MAFMAVLETVPAYGWWLFIANLTWTVAYDTMYAMVDRDDDLKIGVKSSAILFGQYDVLIVMALQVFTLITLWCVGLSIGAAWPYFLAVLFAALLCVRQYQLIKRRQREGCFTAFLENHLVGLSVTVGLAVNYLLY